MKGTRQATAGETVKSTRERVREEAAALFRERGYNGTSMSELARRVGITKSSLYHHFPSKQALLAEIIELTVNRVTPLVEEVAASEAPVAERLRRVVAIHTVEAIRDQDAVACFTEEGRYLSPEFMVALVAKRDDYERIFRQILTEGILAGEFLPQDADLTVKGILGMCNSAVRWYRPTGPYTPEELADRFARFAVTGVSGTPDRAGTGTGADPAPSPIQTSEALVR